MIHVTRSWLPDRRKFDRYLDSIYASARLTNHGPLVRELTERLEAYLGVNNLLLVANGTLALQVAYRALEIRGSAVTTPFSFVATASSLVWEGIRPYFADIDPVGWCLDPAGIAAACRPDTGAVVAVHVFGNPCPLAEMEQVTRQAGLKLIYDAAHAFAVRQDGVSVLAAGDASTLSFHATKIFHTLEGGAIVFRDPQVLARAKLLINFGITGPESIEGLGINAKMNEVQAAMGLCMLDEMETILAARAEVWQRYQQGLKDWISLQRWSTGASNNGSYFPVRFATHERREAAVTELEAAGIQPRRYFAPSLDELPYLQSEPMPYSRALAARVLCLPIFAGMDPVLIDRVVDIVRRHATEKRGRAAVVR